MPTWDEAADWYADGVRGDARAFNDLAAALALELVAAGPGGPRRRGPAALGGRDVLDIGCGEGHVARRLARAGARVVAVEPTAALLLAAVGCERTEPLGIDYRPGRAEALGAGGGPGLPDAAFDAAVAVLVLHHVSDLTTALAEAHRVLRPGGVLAVVLPHPWTDHPGAAWTTTADGTRRALGRYTAQGFWSSGTTGPDGRPDSVRDIGWHHRTLATWLTALAGAGFALREVREPTGADAGRTDGWADVPRLLALAAVRT